MSMARYDSYKDSGVEWLGEVPSHWRARKLKFACHVFPSNVDKKSQDGQEMVKLCNYTDVYYNEIIDSSLDFMVATATDDQIGKFSLTAGDTIFTKDSETADDIAIAAYVPESIPGVICGYHLSIARPRESTCGAFVKRVFDSHYAKAKFCVLANGLTRVGLGQYAVDNVEIPLPPLPEQRAIAGFLDRETGKIDALVAEQRRLIELLKEKRQALISHAVTKGLDPHAPMKPSGIDWLGDVPAHWEVKRLGYLSRVVRGASPRPAGAPEYFSGDFMPWITVGEITKDDDMYLRSTDDMLTELGVEQSRVIEAGTVVLSNSGATLGVPKILAITGCANDGVVAFEDLFPTLDSTYLCHYLGSLTDNLRERIKQGSGQPNLNTDIVKGLAIALPPVSEQESIVAFLEATTSKLFALTAEAERGIELLQERRTALISAAVTGKIDVRHLAGEGAA